ncbi:SCO family protein [Thermaurantimonas aggregans]|uniref:SCO family protein n=1 Tax=Thermaurantimonas aggregans TaxID=2173829 RepID=A0A401XKL9_9FLAO|nr:SCO family protein [Thermaurantimonas aggregans]MCX8147896.1 SCO family protein [Thermaurantimonas aggregans]GCD77559.1 SCO family protein [Thermaurantimonas aggregans]
MKKSKYILYGAIAVALITVYIFGGYIMQEPERLPVYNPIDINPELVDSGLQRVGRNFHTGPFKVINHLGDTVTEETVKNRIRVVNFFFTTCPSICIDMTRELRKVQEAFRGDQRIVILSHTVMPEVDSLPVLREYARMNEIDSSIWWLVRADQDEIQRLARKVYFVVKSREHRGDDDDHSFIHTENVVLVDTKGRLRGFYDGTDPEDMQRLIRHIHILFKDDTPKY